MSKGQRVWKKEHCLTRKLAFHARTCYVLSLTMRWHKNLRGNEAGGRSRVIFSNEYQNTGKHETVRWVSRWILAGCNLGINQIWNKPNRKTRGSQQVMACNVTCGSEPECINCSLLDGMLLWIYWLMKRLWSGVFNGSSSVIFVQFKFNFHLLDFIFCI